MFLMLSLFFFNQHLMQPIETVSLLDVAIADVTGDHVDDTVFLMRENDEEALQLMLVVKDGQTNRLSKQLVPVASFSQATLFLGDFTADAVSDIFIEVVDKSKRVSYEYFVYRAKWHDLEMLFNSMDYFLNESFEVTLFEKGHVVVTDQSSDHDYELVLQEETDIYDALYDDSNALKGSRNGEVLHFEGMYPIKRHLDIPFYELRGVSRIVSEDESQTIGLLEIQFEYEQDVFYASQKIIGYIEFLH